MDFYNKTHELMRTLKDTTEYKNYIKIKKEISEKPELRDKLKEFKTQKREEQLKYISGKEITEESKKEMQQLYFQIAQNEEIMRFFEAEIKLDVMLTDMQKIINEALKDVVDI